MLNFIKKSILWITSIIISILLSILGQQYGEYLFALINETVLIKMFSNYQLNKIISFLYINIKEIAWLLSMIFIYLIILAPSKYLNSKLRGVTVLIGLAMVFNVLFTIGYANSGLIYYLNLLLSFSYFMFMIRGLNSIFIKKGEKNECK